MPDTLTKLDFSNAQLAPSAVRAWVHAVLAAHDLDATLRAITPDAWLTVWKQLPYQPVSASLSVLSYQLGCLEDAGQHCHELSLVLRSGGRSVGILPLCMNRVADQWRLSAMGAPISTPLFAAGLSTRTVKTLCTRILSVLRHLAQMIGLQDILIEQACWPVDPLMACSEWHQQLMCAGAHLQTRHVLFTDLNPELAAIRATFRKSYRSLINVALKTWQTTVLDADSIDAETWAAFMQLHKYVAGRSTRSAHSWQQQWNMVLAREAFLVTIRAPTDQRLVGAGLFVYTATEGLYGVGAYDRTLFDKPLGHAVQQRAIETLKGLGLCWYQIGERHYRQSPHGPSDKEVTISEFKQGFASHLFCRYQFRLPVDEGSAYEI